MADKNDRDDNRKAMDFKWTIDDDFPALSRRLDECLLYSVLTYSQQANFGRFDQKPILTSFFAISDISPIQIQHPTSDAVLRRLRRRRRRRRRRRLGRSPRRPRRRSPSRAAARSSASFGAQPPPQTPARRAAVVGRPPEVDRPSPFESVPMTALDDYGQLVQLWHAMESASRLGTPVLACMCCANDDDNEDESD